MSTTASSLDGVPGARRRAPRLGYVVAAAAAGLACWFLYKAASPYLHWDAAHYGRYWSARGWLALHVGGGLLALACGAFQLWSGLNGRTSGAHRLSGRLYALGVVAGSVGGLWIAIVRPAFPTLGPPLIMLAAAWLSTTGLAVAAIRRGQVALHKELMIRSYVVTFAFVFFRWWADSPVFTDFSLPERFSTIGWLCWTLPLLVTELILQGRRIASARPA